MTHIKTGTKLFRKQYGRFKFSTSHGRKLTKRQEKFFHAHQECPQCRKGIPHTHEYEKGKLRFYFRGKERHLEERKL